MAISNNHWDEATLWAKAVLYTRVALESDRDSWFYPFWSSLALEFVARAALAHVSPTLLADPTSSDVNNLLYALGHSTSSVGLKSAGIAEVLSRCERVVVDFTADHKKFCSGFTGRRNEELHTGSTAFADLRIQSWLPRYYESCKALLSGMDRELSDLFGSEAVAAQKMIDALNDQAAKQVNQSINAHKTVWREKSATERGLLMKAASIAAQPHLGHVIDCPACESNALLTGEVIAYHAPVIEGEDIVERSTILATELNCKACGLHIQGHAQLHACEFAGTFTHSDRYDGVDFYGVETEDQGNYEPYNNE